MGCNTLVAFAGNWAIFKFETITFGWQVALPRKRIAFLFSFLIFALNMLAAVMQALFYCFSE
jgi:hypothetical protein